MIWQSGAETGSDGTGRRPWTEASLRELHQRLLAARLSYRPPEHLLTELNEEYRGFVANHDGKSGYYQWLALLVRELAPGLILELGSFLGVSALMMLSELGEQSRLVCCDVEPNFAFFPEHARRDPRVRLIVGDDTDLAIFGEHVPQAMDLLFIDTEHSLRQVEAEWSIYQHLCKPGTIVVLDDIRLNDMGQFWERVPYPKLDITEDCHFSGFGMFAYEASAYPNPALAWEAARWVARLRGR